MTLDPLKPALSEQLSPKQLALALKRQFTTTALPIVQQKLQPRWPSPKDKQDPGLITALLLDAFYTNSLPKTRLTFRPAKGGVKAITVKTKFRGESDGPIKTGLISLNSKWHATNPTSLVQPLRW